MDNDITKEKNAETKIDSLTKELDDIKTEVAELINERKTGKKSEKVVFNKKKTDEKWSEQEFDCVFLFDEHANILDCNDNMYKRLGYSKTELLSLNMADFDALESKQDLIEKINKAKKKGVYTFKTIHKRKDGSAILVQENFQYLEDKNTFKCIVREDFSTE